MNYIDIILGILLIIAAIRGFHKGFIIEVASLLALILGIWGALILSKYTANFIVESFNYEPEFMGLISFLITFGIIVVLVHILGNILDQIIKALFLGFLNHIAGMLFGVLKSALVLSIILLLIDKVDNNVSILPQDVKQESRVYEPIKNLVPTILPFLNFWDDDVFNQEKETVKEKTDKA